MMRGFLAIVTCVLVLAAALSSCQGSQPTEPGPKALQLQIQSSSFADGGTIPTKYTCDGQDTSPPLSWAEPPPAAQSLALIVDDPDAPAGSWVHWVLFNLPASTRALPESLPADDPMVAGGLHGTNSWKKLGYGGPCPPKGSTHRYFFKLYALDTTLDLDAGASRGNVEKAMAGHILAEGQLVGQYGR
jgi:Raf kinase inhibitor-like YbhB/YbcL family protein